MKHLDCRGFLMALLYLSTGLLKIILQQESLLTSAQIHQDRNSRKTSFISFIDSSDSQTVKKNVQWVLRSKKGGEPVKEEVKENAFFSVLHKIECLYLDAYWAYYTCSLKAPLCFIEVVYFPFHFEIVIFSCSLSFITVPLQRPFFQFLVFS